MLLSISNLEILTQALHKKDSIQAFPLGEQGKTQLLELVPNRLRSESTKDTILTISDSEVSDPAGIAGSAWILKRK